MKTILDYEIERLQYEMTNNATDDTRELLANTLADCRKAKKDAEVIFDKHPTVSNAFISSEVLKAFITRELAYMAQGR